MSIIIATVVYIVGIANIVHMKNSIDIIKWKLPSAGMSLMYILTIIAILT